jgi:hypothetical protein
MRNHRLESRVRENHTHGSEGGEGESLSLYPYQVVDFTGFRLSPE